MRALKTSLLALALLALTAPAALAHDGGEGLWGETNDKVITNAGFILIAFFPLFVLFASLIQWQLEKRKDARKAPAKARTPAPTCAAAGSATSPRTAGIGRARRRLAASRCCIALALAAVAAGDRAGRQLSRLHLYRGRRSTAPTPRGRGPRSPASSSTRAARARLADRPAASTAARRSQTAPRPASRSRARRVRRSPTSRSTASSTSTATRRSRHATAVRDLPPRHTVFAGAGDYHGATRDRLHSLDAWYGYPEKDAHLTPTCRRGCATSARSPSYRATRGRSRSTSAASGAPRTAPPRAAGASSTCSTAPTSRSTTRSRRSPTVAAEGLLAGGPRRARTRSCSRHRQRRHPPGRADRRDRRAARSSARATSRADSRRDCGRARDLRTHRERPPTALQIGRRSILVRTIDAAGNGDRQRPFPVDVITPSDRGALNGAARPRRRRSAPASQGRQERAHRPTTASSCA